MEAEKKTSVFSNGLIWFGAAVSIAEIMTGIYFAPLGFGKGLLAIIIGHLIGGALLYFTGLIGANTEKSAMETVKLSFGRWGSLLFCTLNVIQLAGWTAVMIASGASAASGLFDIGSKWIYCIVIALLIIVWMLVGVKNMSKLNIVAMGALFLLTIALSVSIFKSGGANALNISSDQITFGAAIELSIAMPLSWLPLIADYTRFAKRKKAATLTSAIVYSVVSIWMYVIGMGAALFTGESEIAGIISGVGGIAALIIVIFSTVTTTFLDAYSAGVSALSISRRVNEKWIAIAVCVIGAILAMIAPMSSFESFLYVIGSVFAPMTAILLTDRFILKSGDKNASGRFALNIIVWVIGFALYRVFLNISTPLGSTVPVMAITGAVTFIANKLLGGRCKNA